MVTVEMGQHIILTGFALELEAVTTLLGTQHEPIPMDTHRHTYMHAIAYIRPFPSVKKLSTRKPVPLRPPLSIPSGLPIAVSI